MTIRVLSQDDLVAATDTDLIDGNLVAPTLVTCVNFCNRTNFDAAIRLWVRKQGATTADEQYLIYDYGLPSFDFKPFTWGSEGFTLSPGDLLTARSDVDDVSVTVFGKS